MTEPTSMTEPNEYIGSESFYHPRPFISEESDEAAWTSTYGIRLGDVVIHVCDGSLVANPIKYEPNAANYDMFMLDMLPTEPVQPKIVVWDPATLRYVDPE